MSEALKAVTLLMGNLISPSKSESTQRGLLNQGDERRAACDLRPGGHLPRGPARRDRRRGVFPLDRRSAVPFPSANKRLQSRLPPRAPPWKRRKTSSGEHCGPESLKQPASCPPRRLPSAEELVTTRSLLLRTVAALTLTAGLSLLCVLFVDRPAASFLHEHSAVGSDLWQLGPRWSDRLKYFSALAIFFVVVWRDLEEGRPRASRAPGHGGQPDRRYRAEGRAEMGLRPLLAGNVDPRQSLLDRPRRLWLSPVPRRHRIRLVPFGTRRRGLLGRRDSVDRLSSRAMVLCGRLRRAVHRLGGDELPFRQRRPGGAAIGWITGVYMARLFRLDQPRTPP